MPSIKAIVGLGNPGSKYEKTRHNAGFMVIDRLAKKLGVSWKPGKGQYYRASTSLRGESLLLVKPTTYMNESGRALFDIVNREELKPSEILIVYDDFALPLGTLRFRGGGSDGGHNGVNSIIYHLGTENIPRLRIGIGPLPENGEVIDFVLNEFEPQEEKILQPVIQNAVAGLMEVLHSGLVRAQSLYNRKLEDTLDKE